MKRAVIAYIPSSHLDLYWLGNYKTCLERGSEVIRGYLDRCLETPDETFFLETVIFADHFLKKHPEYRERFLGLLREGRLEVGAAYVDRWETLVPAESLIRNVQIGKRWCRQELSLDNPLVTHPDLPSFTAQIPQVYSQLGLKYYVTSRKVYRHGQVWRFRAPDGSRILVLNWPRHYVFPLMHASDVPPEVLKTIWVPPLDIEETLKGFPLGTVAASGSAGDLAGRETFRERYRQNLEDYVAAFRLHYPDFDFTYSVPSKILAPYLDAPGLPEHAGEVPSVWGVAGDEEYEFFLRDRLLENQLLNAETLAALAPRLGLSWRPPSADRWQGMFYEQAFFARKDPILPGQELDALWRMHIFTQDHNGGGQEGALSMFQKRVTQQRALAYSAEIAQHSLAQLAARLPAPAGSLLVFNPHGQPWSGPIEISVPAAEAKGGWTGPEGAPLPVQQLAAENGQVRLQVDLPAVPALGYRSFAWTKQPPAPLPSPVQVSQEAGCLRLSSPALEVDVDLRTGALVRLLDRQRGQDWGSPRLGCLSSLAESGNDVTLRFDASIPPALDQLAGLEVLDAGPLFTRLRIRKTLLKAAVEQTLTLWAREPRLDLETRVYWWGLHRQQVRLNLSGALSRADLSYGVPFYGAGWTETVEGCGPWNSDEISPEDQLSYREVHGWVQLQGAGGGLTVCTHLPGFHHGPEGLSAVLFRTPPSCGDGRLFFENAGEHVFTFSFFPGPRDWKAAGAPRLAARVLRQPLYALAQAAGDGTLPSAQGFLEVSGERFALSCLYPSGQDGALVARVWETSGQPGTARFSGPLAAGQAFAVDFMEEGGQPLHGAPGAWELDVPAWGIRTVLFKG